MGAAEIMGSLFGVGKVFGHFRVTLSVLEVRASPFFPGTNRFFQSSGRISRLFISEDEIGGDSSGGNMGSPVSRQFPGQRQALECLLRGSVVTGLALLAIDCRSQQFFLV